MQEQTNAIEDLFSKATDYLETKVELLELKAAGKTSDIASSFVSGLVIGIVSGLVIIFLNIGIAIWLGGIFGSLYLGFFTVAAFYLVVLFIVYLTRAHLLKTPVKDAVIKYLLN